MAEGLRVVFMGTPQFAASSLERLIRSRHEIVAVYSQPDRAAGRGKKTLPTPTKALALEHGIPVLQPERIKRDEAREQLAELAPDVVAVVAYGQILPQRVLDLPRYGCLNVHASLLPKYRGAAPIQWALINGERESGVTIMQMDAGMDTGAILRKREVDILDDDDAESLSNMLSVIGAEELVATLDAIADGDPPTPTPQNDAEATMAPLLTKEDGRLDWRREPDQIVCRVMGLRAWPGAFATMNGQTYKIHKASTFYPEELHGILHVDQKPGEIIDLIPNRGPVVRAGESALALEQIQPPNRKPVSGTDAINGKLFQVGDRFDTPTDS